MTSFFCHLCNHTLSDGGTESCPGCGARAIEGRWPTDRRLGLEVVGGQYRVIRRLGRGGFGVVYLVETVVGGLKRALKVLHSEWATEPKVRDRFVQEAVLLEGVNHPNVARCYAAGTMAEDHELYLLFELVNGTPLSKVLDQARSEGQDGLDPLRAVRLAKQVASGLVAAHANKILHRDLKPDNLLVVDEGTDSETIKIVDFGIAKALDRDGMSTRHVVGTPEYLAPEQLRPGIQLDARVDLWQLGATLYNLLTGQPPFELNDGGLVELQILQSRYMEAGPAPSSVRPALAAWPALDRLVSRLLASDRSIRPRSAAQVCEELARLEHGMTPGDGTTGPLGLLEALCARPSEQGWWALCRFLGDIDSDDERNGLVASAETLLLSWPDELRRAPLSWWETVKRGEAHSLWPLARLLDLSNRGLTDTDVEDLAACPEMSSITRLDLSGNEVGQLGSEALAYSVHLTALECLILSSNRIGPKGLEALSASLELCRLRSLLLDNNAVGMRGAEALAVTRLELQELDLSGSDIGPGGAAAISSSKHLTKLRRLRVADADLGSDGAGAIAVSHELRGLEELDLSGNSIGPGGAAAIALSPKLDSLENLSLARNQLGVEGIELLMTTHRFSRLESLDLSSNSIGARGAMFLASSPFSRRLKHLDLSDNGLGDAGVASLLGAAHLSGLRSLGLAQNDLTAAGAALLGGIPPELGTLDVSASQLGLSGALGLINALSTTRLKELRIERCELGLEGSLAILSSSLPIESLSLAANAISVPSSHETDNDAITGLQPTVEFEFSGRSPVAQRLVALDLSANDLGAAGASHFLTSRRDGRFLSRLEALTLDRNSLAEAGFEELVSTLEGLPKLEKLSLSDNGLGPEAATTLTRSTLSRRLACLALAQGRLGDSGVAALAGASAWPLLRAIDLRGNELSLSAVVTILNAPGMNLLGRLDVAENALLGTKDMHSLTSSKVELLESSFAALADKGAELAEEFYQRLFERFPAVKPLFANTPMRRQQQHLLSTLAMVIESLRDPDAVEVALRELAERHVGYGASPSHYHAVKSVLLATLETFAGSSWSEELEEAWHDGLESIITVMLNAHRQTQSSRALPDQAQPSQVQPSQVPPSQPSKKASSETTAETAAVA